MRGTSIRGTTYRLEGRDGRLGADVGCVIDSHSSFGLLETDIGRLANPVEAAIAGSEVQDGCPVVGEIFGEGARRACGLSGNVLVHLGTKGIAADNLMEMRALVCSRVDEAIKIRFGQHRKSSPPEPARGIGGRVRTDPNARRSVASTRNAAKRPH